jgi:peptide methionine sulfoxide reductase MsrB
MAQFLWTDKKGNIVDEIDNELFMRRTEIKIGKCGDHLDHAYNDGPESTIRYQFSITEACKDKVGIRITKESFILVCSYLLE